MDFELILRFLQSLSKNNDRNWFEKNKSTYLKCKDGFDEFLARVLSELLKFDPALTGLNPKKLAFRIYRDIRFSKDKRPYKVNMGAGFSPGGKMIQEPGYYLHIEPGNKSLLAGGLYMPDAANLVKIRQEIDYNPEGILKVLKNKKFKTSFASLDDFDKLKTSPKGYPKDHPHLDLLRHRSFIVSHNFTDREVKDRKFIKKVAETAKLAKSLNDFLRGAIA